MMADETNKRTPVEIIPSGNGEVSAIASAGAPFVYFDMASTFGFNGGIGNITLEAKRFHLMPDGQIALDRVIVAHMRLGHEALRSLKEAVDAMLLLAEPVPDGPKH